MKMFASVYKAGHSKNSLFLEKDITHKYNPLSGDIFLRDIFLSHGIVLNTSDINNKRKVEFEIFFEGQSISNNSTKKFLIAMENPIHNRLNRDLKYLSKFDAVFSWDKTYLSCLDNFHFIHIPNEMKVLRDAFTNKRENFLCLINANKNFKSHVDGNLYYERYKLIRWLEKNFLEDFDLFGIGWGKPYTGIGFIAKQKRNLQSYYSSITGKNNFPSWRGEVNDKSVYANYNFAICYENVSTLSFYITEKILDAMMYGCIPIYWGAPNILDVIPKECFIDRRDFSTTDQLLKFLKEMSEEQIKSYRREILNFITNDGQDLFGYRSTLGEVVKTIMRKI